MSHADSGNSAASTDDAGASSSQDATRQEAEVIKFETEEGGASNKAKAVRVVEPAKIRTPDYSQAILAYTRAGTPSTRG